jgi:hypothetical protein
MNVRPAAPDDLERVQSPVLPDRLTVESFDEAGAREFYDALDESFRDHWEHHSTPFEEWWEQKQKAPDFDPTLWFLIRDDAEIAAVVRNDPNRNEGGMVAALYESVGMQVELEQTVFEKPLP